MIDMKEDILRLVSQIPHTEIVALVSLVLAVVLFILARRAEKVVIGSISATALIFLGLAPLVLAKYVKSQDTYHVKLVVVRPDQSLADIAQVKSDNGEPQMVPGGWELDIPRGKRPADGKVTFSATVKDEFLSGNSTLLLSQDFYPTATVQLTAVTSAVFRGVVVDEDLRAVAGASVSIEGHPGMAVTDRLGKFTIPAHAGNGQMVEVSAKKGQLSGRISAPAGKVAEIIMNSH
jgi:hypothetical protein